jgi:hypothetical protein
LLNIPGFKFFMKIHEAGSNVQHHADFSENNLYSSMVSQRSLAMGSRYGGPNVTPILIRWVVLRCLNRSWCDLTGLVLSRVGSSDESMLHESHTTRIARVAILQRPRSKEQT